MPPLSSIQSTFEHDAAHLQPLVQKLEMQVEELWLIHAPHDSFTSSLDPVLIVAQAQQVREVAEGQNPFGYGGD